VAAPQPAGGATYAHKISKREAWLLWSEPATVLARRVRAFDPEPGACSAVDGVIVKIWSAEAANETKAEAPPGAEAGTVVSASAEGVRVACGQGVLVIRELQRAGGRRLRAREFLAGTPLPAGTRWQLPAPPDRPN
jgi:methionyl-tRNA formyltransferase